MRSEFHTALLVILLLVTSGSVLALPPTANDDTFTGDEDQTISGNVFSNDTGATYAIAVESFVAPPPEQGELTISGDGMLNYVPPAQFNGTVNFSYTIKEQAPECTPPAPEPFPATCFATASGTLIVNPADDAPVAVDDVVSGSAQEDGGPVVVDVLANDDLGDQPTSISGVGDPGSHFVLTQVGETETVANGTVEIVDNEVVFTPAANFWGTVNLAYSITDVDGQTSTAEITIDISAVNDPPTASDIYYETGQNTDLSVAVENGLLKGAYDIDPALVDEDGDGLIDQSLSVVIDTFPVPAEGTILSSTSDGAFVFRPAADFADATSTFQYRVFDGEALSTQGTVHIFVVPNPDAPEPPMPGEVAVLFNLANTPLEQSSAVEPNVLISMDDSGSMDWHINFDGVDEQGRFRIDNSSIASSNPQARNYTYLWSLPNNTYGVGEDCCGRVAPPEEALPPGNDYAVWRARSVAHNAIYYNPLVTYKPWAGYDSSNQVYVNANPSAIRLDPRNSSLLFNILAGHDYISSAVPNWGVNGGVGQINVTGYYIPRYYTSDGTLVEIRAGSTYPGGANRDDCAAKPVCTYAEEIQNFANWFQYYRSGEYAAKATVGAIVAELQDIRVGYETINRRTHREVASMNEYFWEGAKKDLLDTIYSTDSVEITPLRQALDDAGRILACNHPDRACPALPAPEGTCQQNFALLFTDGYWNGEASVSGNQDADGPGPFDGGRYADGFNETLADVAMFYYENDLQPGIENEVPLSASDLNGVPPGTFGLTDTMHQHVKTYTIAFGIEGSVDADTAVNTPVGTPIAWPDPTSSSAAKVDDLLHAAVNGRGRFLNAQDPQELQTAIETAFLEFAQAASSSSAAAFNSSSLREGTLLYRGFYDLRNRTGELTATEVTVDGEVAPDPVWRAAERLDPTHPQGVLPQDRIIVSWNPDSNNGVSFVHGNLTADQQGVLNADQVDYLRGVRARELPTGTLRKRLSNSGLLGDIVNSSPVFVGAPRAFNRDQSPYPTSNMYSTFVDQKTNRSPLVYVGANDGMLHGFDALTGQEKVAYVPSMIIDGSLPYSNKLDEFTSSFYLHNYYVDLTPRLNDVYFDGAWRTVLVGGLGAGGKGFFALDVTSPESSFANQSNAASAVLWEFTDDDDTYPEDVTGAPLGGALNAITDPAGAPVKDLGYALSLPTLTMSNQNSSGEQDWVALFGNGPNSTAGIATLFVLFIDRGRNGWAPGDFVKISTGYGVPLPGEDLAGYPNGLGSPTAVDADLNGTVDYVYAGDRLGNLFRFDMTDSNPANWHAVRLFTATYDNAGTIERQPILSQPLVVKHPQQKGFLVTFGTGSFITDEDARDESIQSVYTIWDDLTPTNPVTAQNDTKSLRLVEQTMSNVVEDQESPPRTRRVLTSLDVPYAAGVDGIYGWYVDLDLPRASSTTSGGANPDMSGNAPPGAQFPGERAIRRFVFRDGVILTTTVLPAADEISCFGAQPGALLVFDHLTGGDPGDPLIDFNQDGEIDSADLVGGVETGASGGLLFGWNQLGGDAGPDGQLVDLATLGGIGDMDFLFVSGGNETISYRIRDLADSKSGRLSWTQLEQ